MAYRNRQSFWRRLLDRIAPLMPADLSRLDRLDGMTDEPEEN